MIREAIAKLLDKTDLTKDESSCVMEEIMSGEASPPQIASYLTALRCKGETVSELVGSVRAMRKNALRVELGDIDAIDLCGTGGDGKHTFNISTTCAFVVAGAGVNVAKHGNRAASSKCGSADLLEELGVAISLTPENVIRCIELTGLGFMFAPLYHPAMKNVAPVRRELGIRTIFNVLGPMSNPADVTSQLIGVFDGEILGDIVRTLKGTGLKSAIAVHGGGYDEATTIDTCELAVLRSDEIREYKLDPRELGFVESETESLRGGAPADNAAITIRILDGEAGPRTDTVLLNAALALMAAGKADKPEDGVEIARESIESGNAKKTLEKLVELSQALAGEKR